MNSACSKNNIKFGAGAETINIWIVEGISECRDGVARPWYYTRYRLGILVHVTKWLECFAVVSCKKVSRP